MGLRLGLGLGCAAAGSRITCNSLDSASFDLYSASASLPAALAAAAAALGEG